MAPSIDYQSVASIYEAMRVEKVNGMTVSDLVGGGYPFPIAVHFMSHLVQYADLCRTDNIWDIGCGCGRLAAALTQHIGEQGSYCGVDVIAGLVDFANRHIASRFPNFRFLTLQQKNPAYARWQSAGKSPVLKSLDEACAPGTIDLCIATSLFTHLDTAMTRGTLQSMHRALKPDGRAFISLFLLDRVTSEAMRRGTPAFRFSHQHERGVWVENAASPLSALAFSLEAFFELLAEQRFYVDKMLYGGWAGRRRFTSGQDIMLIRPMA
ncbi:MAG: class I SAM-dependent methyltransferase [Acetobacteraceae bacterium]|nr:class I SAM-dependent methyltransferase [Acetobacteraceae bacterium]